MIFRGAQGGGDPLLKLLITLGGLSLSKFIHLASKGFPIAMINYALLRRC